MQLVTILLCCYFLQLLLYVSDCKTCKDELSGANSSLCENEARTRGAYGFIKLDNGSCVLLAICANKTIKKYSDPDGIPMLLSMHASSGISPYQLFVNSSMPISSSETSEGRWSKSPFLHSPAFASLIEKVAIILLDDDNSVLVSLEFTVKPDDGLLQSGRWFARDRYIRGKPWKDLTSASFLLVDPNPQVERRFYISQSARICGTDRGYMMIVEKGACSYEMNRKYTPSYLYATSRHGAWGQKEDGLFATQAHEASGFNMRCKLGGQLYTATDTDLSAVNYGD